VKALREAEREWKNAKQKATLSAPTDEAPQHYQWPIRNDAAAAVIDVKLARCCAAFKWVWPLAFPISGASALSRCGEGAMTRHGWQE
jgi:hypothetical protein